MNKTRRTTLASLSLVALGALSATIGARHAFANEPLETGDAALASAERPPVEVWKSPTCGCCAGWVEYLEDEGFEVVAHDTDDVDAIKSALGLTDPNLKSCHTATVGDYVIEGHVPVSDIERLLAERPDVIGISAPGMPMMSPGMGSREPEGYDVVSFDEAGRIELFSRH